MSHLPELILDDEIEAKAAPEHKPTLGSLEARVAERRAKLEAETTHRFDVPGYEGVLKVELQLVGGKRQHAIFKKHEVVRREYDQTLRVGGEIILAATCGFYSVVGEQEVLAENCTWKRLAKAAHPYLDDAVLEAPGGNRVALVTLISEEGVLDLVGEWKKWSRNRGADLEEALEDFS